MGDSTDANGQTHAFVYRNSSTTTTTTPVDSSNTSTASATLVDVQNTYAALGMSINQLNSQLNMQNTLLTNNLSSDCSVFGANNICVGVGGRYTAISNPNSSQSAASIYAAYRFIPSMRAGFFLDQAVSNVTPANYAYKNTSPLAGVFIAYAPSGTALGVQLKLSGAYSNNDVKISRTTLAYTEAGQGSTSLTSYGAQLEGAYGIALGDSGSVLSPLVGIRGTQVRRNGYTETIGATFPISYNAVSQSATTAYAGAKVGAWLSPTVSINASAGMEQDLSSNLSNNSGSIYFLGSFSVTAPTVRQTRAFAGSNLDYWLEKNQKVGLGLYYNQQSLNVSNSLSAMLQYTAGF